MEQRAVVNYQDISGNDISLTPGIIKKYLVNGDATKVTDQELVMFMELCKHRKLNPFIREAYLIKYGNQAASMVVGKDVLLKRAQKDATFAGMEAGTIVLSKDGTVQYRNGSFFLPNEQLVGGWAKVYVKGYTVPISAEVNFDEYVGRKANGEINSQWLKMPGTMIRKVALSQALREAFPETLSQMYDSSEMNAGELPEEPIQATAVVVEPAEEKHICSECGNEIQPYGNMSAEQLMNYTSKKYGKPLCSECATKAAESAKKPSLYEQLA